MHRSGIQKPRGSREKPAGRNSFRPDQTEPTFLEDEKNCARIHRRVRHKIVLSRKADDQNPPGLAEFLLMLFATRRRADYVVGDLNEVFARECKEFGYDRAVRRYWANTLRSLGPLLVRAIGKALKWGAVIAAVRRLF
jgi:hypothetical protein